MARGRKTLQSEVLSVLHEQFDIQPSSVGEETRLREDLDLDSIDLCDMIGVIEKRAGISAQLNDFLHAKTFGDLVATLEALQERCLVS